MPQGADLAGILPLVLIFVVMYFLIIRPQNKKAKQHREMLGQLQKGDLVVTNGGLMGTIHGVDEKVLHLEIAKDVVVAVSRPMVATKLDPGAAPKAPKAVKKETAAKPKKAPAKKADAKK